MKKQKLKEGPPEFYRLDDDMTLADRWMIDHPNIIENDDDTWYQLKLGHPIDGSQPVRILITRDGRPLDYTETSLANPVVSSRTAKLLNVAAPGEVQFLDVRIDRRHRGYKALNILDHIDCLDKKLSVVFPPNKDGRQAVMEVAINSKKVGSRRIFRVATWPVCVIVRPIIKEHFEREGITGAVFRALRSS